MSVFRQSKKNLYKEKHSYKSKHNKVQTINDININKNYVVLSEFVKYSDHEATIVYLKVSLKSINTYKRLV
jgi:ATP-dependent Clp protease adapter protein ClpS